MPCDGPSTPDGARTILVQLQDITGSGRALGFTEPGSHSSQLTGENAEPTSLTIDYSVREGPGYPTVPQQLLDGIFQPHVLGLLRGPLAERPVDVAFVGSVNGNGQIKVRPLLAALERSTGSTQNDAGKDDNDVACHCGSASCADQPSATRHYVVVPIRHDGSVLGLLSIFDAAESSYAVAEQPIQLLADRLGSSLATSLLREARDQAQTDRLLVADRLLELTYEQRELLEQLANIETRERALLAEAVHDDPMQLIVAAMMRLDNVRLEVPGALGEELDRVATVLETSVERLRTIITAIGPPDLSEGLGVALRNLAEGIFLGTTSVVTVIGPTRVHLSAPANAAAFGILREALVNTRQHANARNVILRLEECGDRVVLSVADDGVGAESLNAQDGHIGVATMLARANAENAQLDLDTTPGLGTTVVLTVPMGGPAAP